MLTCHLSGTGRRRYGTGRGYGENLTMDINYGMDRLRFPAPVPSGSKMGNAAR